MEDKRRVEELAVEWYIKDRTIYKKLAQKIENIIFEILDVDSLSYHMVTNRAKTIDSFKRKIADDKYDDPINQITDFAGIRVITYVEDEVEAVCKVIEEAFEIDKEKSLDKSKELGIDKVGYKSIHYIAKLKSDRLKLPEYRIFEHRLFEIQIRTILQHAWAEIEHDRNYKFSGKLPDEITRRFKLLAGSLEMSDREFNNIAREIDVISKNVEIGTKSGKLNFEINSTSLKQYVETKFEELWKSGFSSNFNVEDVEMQELESYGIHTLEELNNIIPSDFIPKVIESENDSARKSLSIAGLIRAILIINDKDKYFKECWKNKWKVWSSNRRYERLYNSYNINWEEIEKEFGVKFSAKKNKDSL